jgi:YfiH family protein
MPVLLAAPQGRAVAAAHAGWRGLAGGVIEAALRALCQAAKCAPDDVSAWLGPCIGPRQFEVGADVLQACGHSARQPDARCFVPVAAYGGKPRWLANLPQLARDRLIQSGVRRISGGAWCTFEERSLFFSYRRDGVTGRLGAAVWIRH